MPKPPNATGEGDPGNKGGPTEIASAADFLAYWSSMPGWKVSEASALLLMMDPDNRAENRKSGEYKKLKKRLKRAVLMNTFSSPSTPKEVLEWAISNNLIVDESLKKSVSEFKGIPLQNWRRRYRSLQKKYRKLSSQDKVPKPKRKSSFLRLILAFAIHFRHKLGGKDTTSKIQKNYGKIRA